jgi:valyl-tRNA synthetase
MTFTDRYNHKIQEKYWQEQWEKRGIYAFQDDQPRENTYVIDTPPPTVSGQLHMGHIYSYTHADFMARYKRMKGFDVCYPMGFDDNGLPTERLVEKQEKVRAKDVSREEFIGLCERVSQEARREFRSLFSATALSVDWSLEYHTISEEVRRLSQASFIDLYEKGHVERRLQPMLWDVVDQTAIAQAEVEDKELEGVFVDIRFEVEGGEEHGEGATSFTIGTTRPEMLPACVGIFYHPDDERYKPLAGKFAITPLFGVRVPILADESVEMEKGTGIMMCCTFGDEADIEKWRKHGLETRIIINKYGNLSLDLIADSDSLKEFLLGQAFAPDLPDDKNLINIFFDGKQKVKAARAKVIELLEEAGVLEGKKAITHAVKCAERSGAPLEILPSQQWFVKILEHKEALKEKSKSCNWNPTWMQKRMEQWIDGLNWDWCISRQRYYGVPFPVWYFRRNDYDSNNEDKLIAFGNKPWEVFVCDKNELPVNPLAKKVPDGFNHYGDLEDNGGWGNNIYEVEALQDFPEYKIKKGDYLEFIPDTDVMDTWATSSLTPQIAASKVDSLTPANAGVQRKNVLDSSVRLNSKCFPADLRPQAHEIIRTWAFYTLVKSHLHSDSKPWDNLMISGWCLASDKTKMSKSKGNVITPLSLLEEKSADAVRYWASTAKLGTDTAFSEDLLKIGAKLVNKLWNASKFVAGQLQAMSTPTATATQAIESGIITHSVDRWLIARVQHMIAQADSCFADYDYAGARMAVEDIFWNDFCDNYLEIVKSRAYGNMGEAAQQSALHTMYHCLNAIIKLFAPFVPHITEEIFSVLYAEEYAQKHSIHARGMFPDATAYEAGVDYITAEKEWDITKALVELIRKAKSERGVSIKYPIDMAVVEGMDSALFSHVAEDIKAVGNIHSITQGTHAAHDMVSLHDDACAITLHVVFAEKADVA